MNGNMKIATPATTTAAVWVRVLVLAAFLVLPLSACNTVEGLGRDARAAGDAITGAASKSKGY